jgi:hypothetical protein
MDMYSSSTNLPVTYTFTINKKNEYSNDQAIVNDKSTQFGHNILNVNDFLYANSPASINSQKLNSPSQSQSQANAARISYGNMINLPMSNILNNRHVEMQYNDCSDGRSSKTPDEAYCNFYHACHSGNYQPLLCPDGYMFSSNTLKCEQKSKVECGKRIAMDFDRSNVPFMDHYMNDYYNAVPNPKIINGSLECMLGTDGYFADPEFCNIYHHCLAGVDYAEQCPHQLVWNDRKKMCDWQTSVNCTGRIIPVAQGAFPISHFTFTSFFLNSIVYYLFYFEIKVKPHSARTSPTTNTQTRFTVTYFIIALAASTTWCDATKSCNGTTKTRNAIGRAK